ncbi:MAG: cytochrome c4 [Porticoccaceae bacterium]|nr:cytochrome c4 [Porticoccaceae bacterium]
MNPKVFVSNTLPKRQFSQEIVTAFLLIVALGCSTSLAGSGHIPTNQDSYPEGVVAIPAQVSQCLACHGPNGQSPYEDWPSLAGQKKSYLLQQLKYFKSGTRNHPMMLPVVSDLSDADMEAVSDYFSSQLPAQPPETSTVTTPASAAPCRVCHDNNRLPLEPFLNGQQANYLDSQIRAFRSGIRKDPVMNAMTQGLSDKDISELATYFSAQSPIALLGSKNSAP